MTRDESQGQSLSTVGLHLPNPVFPHRQLYVALSCCTDSHNLHVLLPPDSNGCTDNIVYKEVLNISTDGSGKRQVVCSNRNIIVNIETIHIPFLSFCNTNFKLQCIPTILHSAINRNPLPLNRPFNTRDIGSTNSGYRQQC
jgi:hypothetical protein